MQELSSYEYAIVRVVPRVECEEFVNVGAIVFCRVKNFLEARIDLDPTKILRIFPEADLWEIERHLMSISLICQGGHAAGPIGQLEQHERFQWLVAPRSTIIQTSPTHSGLCDNPSQALDQLVKNMSLQI